MAATTSTRLLAVPNISNGDSPKLVAELATSFQVGGSKLLDLHSDADHHRSVFTLAGSGKGLVDDLFNGIKSVSARVDITAHKGVHPFIGAVDVAPLVYLDTAQRGSACAAALTLADRLGSELSLPVFLYGQLAGGRTRAELRKGGPQRLAQRISTGELKPDFGPSELHTTAGAVMITARPPLIAFNVELADSVTLPEAKAVAALIREGGEQGLPSVRAIGLQLESQGIIQISTNIEDFRETSPAQVVEAITEMLPVTMVELVGLAPEAAFESFPSRLQFRGPEPAQRSIEQLLKNCD